MEDITNWDIIKSGLGVLKFIVLSNLVCVVGISILIVITDKLPFMAYVLLIGTIWWFYSMAQND